MTPPIVIFSIIVGISSLMYLYGGINAYRMRLTAVKANSRAVARYLLIQMLLAISLMLHGLYWIAVLFVPLVRPATAASSVYIAIMIAVAGLFNLLPAIIFLWSQRKS